MRPNLFVLLPPALLAVGALCYLALPERAGFVVAPAAMEKPAASAAAASPPPARAREIGTEERARFEPAGSDELPDVRVPTPPASPVFPPATAARSAAPGKLAAALPAPALEGPELPPIVLAPASSGLGLSAQARGPGTPIPAVAEAAPAPLPVGITAPAPGVPADDLRQQRVEELRAQFTEAAGDPNVVTPDGRTYADRYMDAVTAFDQQYIAIYGFNAFNQQQAWVVQHDRK